MTILELRDLFCFATKIVLVHDVWSEDGESILRTDTITMTNILYGSELADMKVRPHMIQAVGKNTVNVTVTSSMPDDVFTAWKNYAEANE